MVVSPPVEPLVALIADVRHSKRNPTPDLLRKDLVEAANDINEALGHDLAARASISGGDGLKALFYTPSSAFKAIPFIIERLAPLQLAFGVGRGRLETELDPDDIEAANGPCFHRADEALSGAKKHGGIGFRGFGSDLEDLLSAQYALLDELRRDRTPRQTEIVRAVRENGTQKAAAKALGVSPSVVSESLQAAGVKRIQAIEDAIQKYVDLVVLDPTRTARVEVNERLEIPAASVKIIGTKRPAATGVESRLHRAQALVGEAVWLSQQGKSQEAMELGRSAVDEGEHAFADDPEAAQPALASILNVWGILLRAKGRHEKALEASQRAVEIREELAKQNPERFRPELASALNNLGAFLSDLGRHEEALEASQRAVEIREELAKRNPERFRPDLALALSNLGAFLSKLGRHEEALGPSQRALEVYEELAKRNPERFRPDLASALNNLGIGLSALGRHEEALEPSQRAVEIREELAKRNPERFRPDLASALETRGYVKARAGDAQGGLQDFLSCAEILRDLWDRNPGGLAKLAGELLQNVLEADADALDHHDALQELRTRLDAYEEARS